MNVYINGEVKALDAPITLAQLLQALGIQTSRIALELNRQIVPKGDFTTTLLKESDRIEIVEFVGGG